MDARGSRRLAMVRRPRPGGDSPGEAASADRRGPAAAATPEALVAEAAMSEAARAELAMAAVTVTGITATDDGQQDGISQPLMPLAGCADRPRPGF
jgi:hypothetical protein